MLNEIIVDVFAGGGGASSGIACAVGRSVDVAIIDRDADGRSYSKSAQVARCGNAVPPALAAALVRANLPEMCSEKARESA